MIIRKLLLDAQVQLEKNDIPESYAKYVLNELLLKQDRNLYHLMDEVIDDETLAQFNEIMHRLCQDEPLAYVMGEQYFYGYAFEVNQDVLIPRFETEELVMRVLMELDEFFKDTAATCVDIGTGSGAIACTLKLEAPQLTVYASDISEQALIQAKKNADKLKAEVTFVQGDMAQPFIDLNIKVDVLVCNPPYIPQDEEIQNSVKSFEPHVALFGGEDGLYFYRRVLEDAPKLLNPKNILAFEMGWNQRETLTNLVLEHFPKAQVECFKDINGKDRILIVRNI